MLKVVGIERLPVKVTREVTSPAQGLVLINCGITIDEKNEEPLPVPFHWRVGNWSKPPIDVALEEDTGRFQNLQLVLQDEIIDHNTLLSTDLRTLIPDVGLPVFERVPWSDDIRYIDVHLQPSLSWGEQSSLQAVFAHPPVQVVRTCLIGDSLTFLINEQDEIIGFQLNQITPGEKRIIRWATPRG